MNRCNECIFIGEYRDMGASTPVCKMCDSFLEAVKMPEKQEPCKLKVTWKEVKEYAKRREVE